jgi:hypothetical protein
MQAAATKGAIVAIADQPTRLDGQTQSASRASLARFFSGSPTRAKVLAWLALPASVPYGFALGACSGLASCHPAPGLLVVLGALFVAAVLGLTAALAQAGDTMAFLARKTQRSARGVESLGWGAALGAAAFGSLALLVLVALLLGVFPLPVGGLLCLAIARRRRLARASTAPLALV